MASISIQGRVDGELWGQIRGDSESVTEALQKVTEHYAATQAEALAEIAPTPCAAVAILLRSHHQLNQLMENAVIALPTTTDNNSASTEQPSSEQSALDSANDW